MMNVASFFRAPTILWACAQAGARVAAVVAKDKLRQLIGAGLADVCASAEQEGVPVYSCELSLHGLRRGVDMMRTMPARLDVSLDKRFRPARARTRN